MTIEAAAIAEIGRPSARITRLRPTHDFARDLLNLENWSGNLREAIISNSKSTYQILMYILFK